MKPGAQVPTKRGTREFLVRPSVGYQLLIPDLGVYLDLTRVRREHHETQGLLTVRAMYRGAKTVLDNVLSSADFNCSSSNARTTRAKLLSLRGVDPDIDWEGILEELCVRVLDAEDVGEPAVVLQDVPITYEDDAELAASFFPLLKRHPTIWFGDGGTAKSYLALYAAVDLAQHGQNVLYCDWEFTPQDHRRRLGKILGPIPAIENLYYRRCDRPLCRDVIRLRDIIHQKKITYLICDSLGFAADGTPESAEAATNYYRALRELGSIGSLHLAHISKAEEGDKKPFGSVFWANGARSIWNMKRSKEDDRDDFAVGFIHRKSNLSRLRPAFGAKLEFIGTEMRVTPTDATIIEEVQKDLAHWERMKYALKDGPLTTTELKEATGLAPGIIRTTLSRKLDVFTRHVDDRIALRDEQAS